jgi:GNAT superfamily N-acetyltransferase
VELSRAPDQKRVTLMAVPSGHVGAVVTALEMTERPRPAPLPPSPLRLVRWREPDAAKYRILFERVGAKWLWYSRLALSDRELRATIGEVHAVEDRSGVEVGLVELEFPEAGTALIRFLGLVPELTGRGHGRWLVAQALALAWRRGIGRVELFTCSLDHPAALPAYLRAGFGVTGRSFESFPDPRLVGLLPRSCAPQVPLLGARWTDGAAGSR